MPIRLNSPGGGAVSIDVPSTASTFTLTAPARTGNIITSADSGTVTGTMIAANTVALSNLVQPLTLMTAQNSTSGTFIDFTGIPSWARRVTVMFNNISTNGSASYLLQIGAGSITSSGYVSNSTTATGTNNVLWTSSTAGFAIFMAGAAEMLYGHMILTHLGNNTWISSHTTNRNGWTNMGAGAVTLGGTLDRVRLTTTNGTDAFDLGNMNVMYE